MVHSRNYFSSNPADLSNSALLIKDCLRFHEVSRARDNIQDATQHPALTVLPGIFLRTMKGISDHVDGFLGKKNCMLLYVFV